MPRKFHIILLHATLFMVSSGIAETLWNYLFICLSTTIHYPDGNGLVFAVETWCDWFCSVLAGIALCICISIWCRRHQRSVVTKYGWSLMIGAVYGIAMAYGGMRLQ